MSRPRSPQRPPTAAPAALVPVPGIPAGTRPSLDPAALPPGPGAEVPGAARARIVAETTGLPVALLDGAAAPLEIDASVEPADGRIRYTGTTTLYPAGVSVCVSAYRPHAVPAGDPAETQRATVASGLFSVLTVVVDGVALPATGCRTRRGGPMRSWTVYVDGWLVTVRGAVPAMKAVRLVRAGMPPGPGSRTSPAARIADNRAPLGLVDAR
ncbi:hypothetical protein ACIQOV_21270 [Kitasatospora sp. NPDC091257]|uniref:hypothetical protein n=1 Tax=Kitasatospora sp. NPDC091257 TaxID=3364084 RepID=UPI00381115CE